MGFQERVKGENYLSIYLLSFYLSILYALNEDRRWRGRGEVTGVFPGPVSPPKKVQQGVVEGGRRYNKFYQI